VGWLIAQPELLAKATMCKQFSDAHTSTFAQATAAQYLKSGRMPATLKNVRQVYAERAQAMAAALEARAGGCDRVHAAAGRVVLLGAADGRRREGEGRRRVREARDRAGRGVRAGGAVLRAAAPFSFKSRASTPTVTSKPSSTRSASTSSANAAAFCPKAPTSGTSIASSARPRNPPKSSTFPPSPG
jgi:DNA-binding transcriptional MocR family regulator